MLKSLCHSFGSGYLTSCQAIGWDVGSVEGASSVSPMWLVIDRAQSFVDSWTEVLIVPLAVGWRPPGSPLPWGPLHRAPLHVAAGFLRSNESSLLPLVLVIQTQPRYSVGGGYTRGWMPGGGGSVGTILEAGCHGQSWGIIFLQWKIAFLRTSQLMVLSSDGLWRIGESFSLCISVLMFWN